MTDYPLRRARLLETVDTDGFIAVNQEDSDPVSLRYLTGFTGEGALVLWNKQALLLTDSRYTQQARQEVEGVPIEEAKAWSVQGLRDALRRNGLSHVTVASDRVSVYWHGELQRDGTVSLHAVRDPVARLRKVKTEEEVAHLRHAVQVAEGVLTELLPWIRVGMTEAEIALELEMRIRRSGVEGIAFSSNVSAGANTALNHYNPFHHPATIQPGDLVLFDFGASVQGYRSDITRTVVVGDPTDEQRMIYDTVLRANQTSIRAIRGGMTGVEADAVARDIIVQAGYGEAFGHGLGHGIGLEVHEAPSLSPRSLDTLEAGMVVTVEPGIYFPSVGGVRIEDDVVIRETGCDVITSFPKEELICVG